MDRRTVELQLVATLLARIDAPNVDAKEGAALVATLRKRCEAADAVDIFELAMTKPHVRAWSADEPMARVRAAIDDDSIDVALPPSFDAFQRTTLAVEALQKQRYRAYEAIVKSGDIKMTREYFAAAIGGTVPTAVFNQALAMLEEAVARQAMMTHDEALALLATCQLEASGTSNFPRVFAACAASLTRLVEARAKRQREESDTDEDEDDDDLSKREWCQQRRAVVEAAFAHQPGTTMTLHDAWMVVHAKKPALFSTEARDVVALARFFVSIHGHKVRAIDPLSKRVVYAVVAL